MQGKVNVLDDHSLAARVGEADLAEFEALAEFAGRGDGVRRGADCWLHGEELEEVFEEYRLFGDVVEAGEDLLNISARTVECAGQEGETAAVSYTHLRAHETGRNLVCRLLLEKKKRLGQKDL